MLIPLTRSTFEALIPAVATGAQYTYSAGKFAELLRRLLISVVGAAVILVIIGRLLPFGAELPLVLGIIVGLYWLWGPVLSASLRNWEYRKFPYAGFWRGEVLDVFISDEVVGNEETVDDRGDLVIVENRERCLNLEVGDETGYATRIRVPIKRQHQAIAVGDVAEMLVLSNREDLGRISKTSDIYIPEHNIWVSDYPYVQREAFVDVSRRFWEREQQRAEQDRWERQQRPRRSRRSPQSEFSPGDSSAGGLARNPRRRSSRRSS